MPTDAPMKYLGKLDGKSCYWAEPGHFTMPGFYFWDGKDNVHVPLLANIEHAASEPLRAKDTLLLQRIEAAKKRLSDLKALHTQYRDGRSSKNAEQVIDEMENLAYSTSLYLDGLTGPYLPAPTPDWCDNDKACDVCGGEHSPGSVPYTCETGDGV